MKNKAMLIGAIDAGKTTLMHALLGSKKKVLKTQSLHFDDWIVDTPGEYTENPLHYKNIMATSLNVTHIIYVQDATRGKSIFPPGFSSGIPKLPIAVVTKSDAENANVHRAITILKKVVVKGPVVITSACDKKGLEHIPALVACSSHQEMRAYISNHPCKDLQYIG